jgi:hypothetical protein
VTAFSLPPDNFIFGSGSEPCRPTLIWPPAAGAFFESRALVFQILYEMAYARKSGRFS